jgi:hypothetical protein
VPQPVTMAAAANSAGHRLEMRLDMVIDPTTASL